MAEISIAQGYWHEKGCYVKGAESKNTRSWHNIAFYGIVSVYMLIYFYDKAKIIRFKKG